MSNTSTTTNASAATTAQVIRTFNADLGWRIERNSVGTYDVINGWGYIGTYPTVSDAERAHHASNRSAATFEAPDGI